MYLGNTLVPRKSLCFSLLSLFSRPRRNQWPNGENGIHWYDPANDERRYWNSRGDRDDNKIRILISRQSID